MSDIKQKLAALRKGTTVTSGETAVKLTKPKMPSESIQVQPVPISVMVDKAFPATKATFYADDPKISAKFELLNNQLGKESTLGKGFASVLFDLHKSLGADPDVVSTLSNEAIALYFKATKRLVVDPSGAKHIAAVKAEVKEAAVDDLLALMDTPDSEDADGFFI